MTAGSVAALLSAGTLGLSPAASAATPKPDNPVGATATITTGSVAPGGTVAFTGTGWSATVPGTGAVIGGVKLDDTEQLNATAVTAAADGTMSGSVVLPSGVTPGEHWLRFLSSDPARSLHATFTVTAVASAPASVTLLSSAVSAGSTFSASGANFGASALVTVKLDKTVMLGTTTANAAGSVSASTLAIPAGTTAGAHTLYFLAAGVSVQVPITVTAATVAPAPSGQQYTVGSTLTGVGGSYEVAIDQGLGKAFVASPKDGATGSVAVVDLATRTVSANWALAAAPYGIAVNTTTHRLYTADTRLGQVSVIDARTGVVLSTITGIAGPHGLEVDSVHNLVYVADTGNNQVVVIDGATNTIVTSVVSGKTPVQVAIDAPHDSYWIAYTGDNTVRQYDRVTNALKSTVTTAAGPQNLVVNPATNELLVDNFRAASVQVIDTTTATITATVPVAASPIGISLDTSTNAYFVTHLAADASTGLSKVSVIDGTSKTVSQVLAVPGVALGVGTDSGSHTTYVTNRDGGQISVIVPVGSDAGGGTVGGGTSGGPRQSGVIVSATIPDTGGLALSVSSTAVSLTPATPNSALTALVSAGTLPTVTVADFRATNPGWTASGKIGDFSSATATFSGAQLGWSPKVLTNGKTQTVVAGPTVKPAASGGLSAGSALATAAAGAGVGTATLNAGLNLSVPTDTKPGTYSATLTLTVI